MQFDKRLREGVRRGEITCSVRIWMRPHVKVGGRHAMEDAAVALIGFENRDKTKGCRIKMARDVHRSDR